MYHYLHDFIFFLYGQSLLVLYFAVAVFVCFLICWTPHHVNRIMVIIVTKTKSWTKGITNIQETIHLIAGKMLHPKYIHKYVYYYYYIILIICDFYLYNKLIFLGCCYLINSAMNPFLYSIFSKRFRRGFYDLIYSREIRCCKCLKNEREDHNTRRCVVRSCGYKGKQVINRQTVLRHFNLRLSSDNQRTLEMTDQRIFDEGNIKQNRSDKRSSSFSDFSVFRDKMVLTTPYKLYSEPLVPMLRSRCYNAKSGKNNLNSACLSTSAPSNIEAHQNGHRCKCWIYSKGTRTYKYRVIFNHCSKKENTQQMSAV